MDGSTQGFGMSGKGASSLSPPGHTGGHLIAPARKKSLISWILKFPWLPMVILFLIFFCALLGPVITPHDHGALNLGLAFKPPFWEAGGSGAYLLGTDNMGRDILSRIIIGARISVLVALWAIPFSGAIGALMGMLAGYFGGKVDALVMRLVDIQMSIPPLALALILAASLRPGVTSVIIVIVVTYWTWYARIVRGEVLSLKERDFIALAKVTGCGPWSILLKHFLPNVLNTLLVLATLQLGSVITYEASLSFLGLGIQPPDVSWGLMLSDARPYISVSWWVITLPGLAIVFTCLGSNLFGDWLRDTLDPRRRQL
jgi:peptide/nickel transport system permease protein